MKILDRIYVDFLMPERFEEYRSIIITAKENGYQCVSMIDYINNYYSSDSKLIILRHDIDSDLKATRRFFQIEKELKVKSTYYFRLCTLDYNLIDEIIEYGSEVGYHYEELATYCKRNKIISKENLKKEHLNEIYDTFKSNLKKYFNRYDIKTIASHGDYYNKKIGIPNQYVFSYFNYKELGIKIEAYDVHLLNSFTNYISDARYKPYWKNNISLFDAINSNGNRILFLSHPGNWESNITGNFKYNILRMLKK